MTKNQKRALLVIAIVLVAFSVIAFVLPFTMNGLFWLSYFCAIIAILVQVYVVKTAFEGKDSVKSKFYGFPIVQVGIIYMVIQMVLSLMFMALAVIVPIWIAVILYVLLLAAAFIGFISADAMRDEIVRQDEKLEANVSCMTTLRAMVYPLAEQCDEPETRKILQELADDFKYSDPVSGDSLKDIESELEILIGELQKTVADGNVSEILSIGKKAKAALTERNRLCKLNKKK